MRQLLATSLFFLILFSACASTRNYEDSLVDWEGKPISEVIKKWGTPSTTASLADGGKMYLYYRKNKENIKVRNQETKQVEPLFDCKTSFLTDSTDTVIGWKYDGHDCRK
jgi:hypothetical protein